LIPERPTAYGDERGLVGKLVVLSLLLVALLALAAVDAGSILLLRVRAGDLADDAANAAADEFADSGDERAAKLAALGTIADSDDRARLQRIEVRRGNVTVEITARADTIVAGRVPFLDDLATVTVTRTSTPP
jgi:uncharacterized membrane protein